MVKTETQTRLKQDEGSNRISSFGPKWYTIAPSHRYIFSPALTHVLPQTLPTPGSPQDLREATHCRDYFTASDCENLLHSIGNLCLVPPSWQQKLSNNPFSEKLSVYREVKLELVKKMINDDNGKELLQWDKNAIERRREKLIEFAKYQWKDL